MIVSLLMSGIFAGSSLYLFRTEKLETTEAGSLYYVYRWGRLHELRGDTNRDGAIDFRARFDPSVKHYATDTPPSEFWEDRNFDGTFEVHVTMDGHQISRVGHDSDGNGSFDRVYEGEPARIFYEAQARKRSTNGSLPE